jgi:hypothetical protein
LGFEREENGGVWRSMEEIEDDGEEEKPFIT